MKICSVCGSCFEDSERVCIDQTHGELIDGPHSVDIISGYKIDRLIASSPRSQIYQARQIEYEQTCTISSAEGHATSQFLSDSKIASRLFHTGVAGVIESGELSNGSSYAVFEGFHGEPLRDVIGTRPLSLLDQIRIARQAAEAIHAIHSAGLLHGSIRPENISIEGLGTDQLSVKVHHIDLGSAFASGVLSNRFSMDSALDALQYFAPERFRGEAATEQSDIYSLGILLYELLSGHPPFQASSATALAEMHLNQKPPEIKIENFDLRMLLTHTISEALQKQPSFRQSTADLFPRQMRHIEQLATHVSTPPPAVAIAMAARVSSVSQAVSDSHVHPKPHRASIVPIAAAAPVMLAKEVTVESHVAVGVPKEVLSEHAVPITYPLASVPPPTKRSRLKGVKRHLQTHLLDLKANATPTLIDWRQPDDDIPSIDAVRVKLVDSGGPVLFDTDEEITQVPAPKDRIEVKWDEKPVERRPFALSLLPSLLSRRDAESSDPSIEEHSGFTAYQSSGHDLGKLPIYGVALCGFLIVGFGIFRIGSALAEDNGGYIGEVRRAPIQVSAPTVQPDPVEPQLAVMNIPAQQIDIPAVVSTSHKNEADVETKEVSQSKPISAGSAKRTKPEPAKVASTEIRQTSKSETPFVPSTLVITRGKGEPKAVVVTKAPATGITKAGSGATRPRIVSIPD